MQRFDVINALIEKNNYKSYLEIGTQNDVCLAQVKCDYKVGVDPMPNFHDEKNSNEFHLEPSDIFFQRNFRMFDIIFVDGLHEQAQVKKDIQNSLKYLRPNGSIVVHDCNPQEEINQRVPMPHVGSWNGDVWKAWIWFRHLATLEMVVVDVDEGCGIIKRGWQSPLMSAWEVSFDDFAKDRKRLLNLISLEEWKESIGV